MVILRNNLWEVVACAGDMEHENPGAKGGTETRFTDGARIIL